MQRDMDWLEYRQETCTTLLAQLRRDRWQCIAFGGHMLESIDSDIRRYTAELIQVEEDIALHA